MWRGMSLGRHTQTDSPVDSRNSPQKLPLRGLADQVVRPLLHQGAATLE